MSASEAINKEDSRQRLVIELEEHFDFRSIHRFRSYCTQRFEGDTEIIIDMDATRYIDSSGIALLLCLYQWVRAPKVEVTVVNCSPSIKHLLIKSHCGEKILIL